MALTHLHHTTIGANLSAPVIMVAFHVYLGPAFLTKEGKSFKTSLDGLLLLSSSVRNVSSYTTWVGKLDCVASSYMPPLVMSITFSGYSGINNLMSKSAHVDQGLKEGNDKLERENKFPQGYIGNLMSKSAHVDQGSKNFIPIFWFRLRLLVQLRRTTITP